MAAIETLAKYLTDGRRVMEHSIALELGGKRREEANEFFSLRNEFGISAYCSVDNAIINIDKTIAMQSGSK